MIEIINTETLTVTAIKETTSCGEIIKFQSSSKEWKQDITVLFLPDCVMLIWKGKVNRSEDVTKTWKGAYLGSVKHGNISMLDIWDDCIKWELETCIKWELEPIGVIDPKLTNSLFGARGTK